MSSGNETSDDETKARDIIDGTYRHPVKLSAQTLTIGCEFEFLLGWFRDTRAEESQFWGVQRVYEALSQTRKAYCSGCGEEYNYKLPVKIEDGISDDCRWQIGVDLSLTPTPAKLVDLIQAWRFQFFEIEVKSRILRFDEEAERTSFDPHRHWISFDREIKFVLHRLEVHFNGTPQIGGRFCVTTTPECGFHVHIGNGKGRPIPFPTVSKVYATYLACERQIDRMHSTNRIAGSTVVRRPLDGELIDPRHPNNLAQRVNVYNLPLSVYFLLSAHTKRMQDFKSTNDRKAIEQYVAKHQREAEYGYDIDAWLNVVRSKNDLEGLRSLTNSATECTINLNNLPSKKLPALEQVSKKLTLEFRQHDGTLDHRTATNWIEFLASLVLHCDKISSKDFGRAIGPGGEIRRPDFGALDLCNWIGAKKETFRFYERLMDGEVHPFQTQLNREKKKWKDTDHLEDNPEWLSQRPLVLELEGKLITMVKDNKNLLMTNKLMSGGYGQFSDKDLDVIVEKGEQHRIPPYLRLGYRSPVSRALLDAKPERKKAKSPPLRQSRQNSGDEDDDDDDSEDEGGSGGRMKSRHPLPNLAYARSGPSILGPSSVARHTRPGDQSSQRQEVGFK